MKWPWTSCEDAPQTTVPAEPDVTTSDETRRAIEAARGAAVQLHEVRSLGARVEQAGADIEAENTRNGFAPLIRRALRAG